MSISMIILLFFVSAATVSAEEADDISSLKQTISLLEDRISKLEQTQDVNKLGNDATSKKYGRAFAEVPVSFTTYLNETRNYGSGQIIVFNKVLHNNGGAYGASSGIFTAPSSGVYLFSWSSHARFVDGEHAYDVWAKLMVNGIHQLCAVAESRNAIEDNQGSNTAIIHLDAGDNVWVGHFSGATAVFGSEGSRTTSFTGALLYDT